MTDIKNIRKEYDELLIQLNDPELISNSEVNELHSSSRFAKARVFEKLTGRKKHLEKILEKEAEIKEIKNKVEENKAIISAEEDQDLTTLAEAELVQIQEKEKNLEKELENLLKNGDDEQETDNSSSIPHSIIVEIRAGAGGQEASLFVADLFRMYSKYAQSQNWKQKTLDSNPTELNGFKEIIFELKGANAFSKMKYEAGVHRVQRIPKTEKMGRVHTSTSSVAVLPRPQKTEMKINPQDLRIDFFRSSGKGGQNVNKREAAVRITHLPSGLAVASQTERNQLTNKENAMAILEARLLEKKEAREFERLGAERKTQIGRAKRAEKIRTYNFPQDRLTDHRIKKSWRNLEEIMEGKLDAIVEELTSSTRALAKREDERSSSTLKKT